MSTQIPTIIEGACHKDDRGVLRYNNLFDVSPVKRMYIIQNSEAMPVRGWQGHRIEQRWFVAVSGQFEIFTIAPDDWEKPSIDLEVKSFLLDQESLNVLHVPTGHITAIRSVSPGSSLLAVSDYQLGAVKDEYRFPLDYFKNVF